jgi:hypothetical protein
MEILRFEEASSTAPKRKKSSKGYLTVGFVAALFGISTAFASSTIAINGSTPVALGQGVSLVAACDESISIVPTTTMQVVTSTPTFFLTSLRISDVNGATATAGSLGVGCGGKTFDVQLFHGSGGSTTAYTCAELNPDNDLTFPTVSYSGATSGTTTSSCSNVAPGKTLSFAIPVHVSGDWSFTIPFIKAPSDITYFTLVSRDN